MFLIGGVEMSREGLLLTPDKLLELEDKIRKEGIENGIQPVNNVLLAEAHECIKHLEWNQYLCQAQLDEVLKPEWKDKPDSEGWWWYDERQVSIRPIKIWQEKYPAKTMWVVLDRGQRYEVDNFSDLTWLPGTWSKAIVPEKE